VRQDQAKEEEAEPAAEPLAEQVAWRTKPRTGSDASDFTKHRLERAVN